MASELSEYSYDKLLDLTARYNRRLQADKIRRLPFLDNATGIAQRPCMLYRSESDRKDGLLTQIYQYRPHRWKKCKRFSSTNPIFHTDIWNGISRNDRLSALFGQEFQIKDFEDEDSRSTWAVGPDYEVDSDMSDYLDENYGGRRRRRKTKTPRISRPLLPTTGSGSRKRSAHFHNYSGFDEDSNDKPVSAAIFICDVCGMRYRSRAGLNYHYNVQHPQVPRTITSRSNTTNSYIDSLSQANNHGSQQSKSVSAQVPNGYNSTSHLTTTHSNLLTNSGPKPLHNDGIHSCSTTDYHGSAVIEVTSHKTPSSIDSDYSCDFCLGNQQINKKTNQPESMLRCSDCGRCAHFSCLQFTENMIKSIRTYRWQCIECKTCWLCGTSENDEQMLFCDDCDRGYHMYCVSPPLSEPPDGKWSCKLCLEHFQSTAASLQNETGHPNLLNGLKTNHCDTKQTVPCVQTDLNNNDNIGNLTNATNST